VARNIPDIFASYLEDLQRLWEDQDVDIIIQETDVQGNQRRHAERYLHWARLRAYAENEMAKHEAYIKNEVWPGAIARAREVHKDQTKPAWATLETTAHQDPMYKFVVQHRLILSHLENQLGKMENAMFMRKDMLQSVGATQREELKAQPRDSDIITGMDRVREVIQKKRASREEPSNGEPSGY
jgi:hypothetical protein